MENVRPDLSIDQKGATSKLLFLGVASLLLSISVFLSVFTALPIALAAVLYGRKSAYGLGFGCLVLAGILNPSFGLLYFLSYVVAIIISEIAIRNVDPIKGIFKSGSMIIAIVISAIAITIAQADKPVKEILVTELQKSINPILEQIEKRQKSDNSLSSQQELQNIDLLRNPEKIADMVIKDFPRRFFIGVFFVLWANTFILLRSRRKYLMGRELSYNEKRLLNFKVPEFGVWILIPAMALYLYGEKLSPVMPHVGLTVVTCLGVFYFFQGFGIYLKFLDKFKIYGFFRTILVILTVTMMDWIVALIGLFDLWIDFSKYYESKEN